MAWSGTHSLQHANVLKIHTKLQAHHPTHPKHNGSPQQGTTGSLAANKQSLLGHNAVPIQPWLHFYTGNMFYIFVIHELKQKGIGGQGHWPQGSLVHPWITAPWFSTLLTSYKPEPPTILHQQGPFESPWPEAKQLSSQQLLQPLFM